MLHPTNPFFSALPPQGPQAISTAPEPWRAAQTPKQECWNCGWPGLLRRECLLMEVGQVFCVAGALAPCAPKPGSPRGIARSIVGGDEVCLSGHC